MPFIQPFGQPFYGSPPPYQHPISHMSSMASAIPLPKFPEPGSPQWPMPLDIPSKILERRDVMDNKLGQLNSIQSSSNKVTAEVSTMITQVVGMEKQLGDLEASRNFDSKTLGPIQGKK